MCSIESATFFDALTYYAKVKEAYEMWREDAALREDMRSKFIFGGYFDNFDAMDQEHSGSNRNSYVLKN